ncbi:MAG: hypothetical protein N2C12_00360 [Planctomycetales bacterium]
MKIQQLVALLPCHSLEDFPFHLEGGAADQILNAYTMLWHPALIAGAKAVPTWRRSDEQEQAWDDCLVAMPQVCHDDMPGYWLDDIRGQGAVIVSCDGSTNRDELIKNALKELALPEDVNPSIAEEFLSLGLCHLLTEVLTVRMRYSSLLDVDRFQTHLVAAAELAISGNEDQLPDALGKCFDALSESKDHFYPVDSYLIDLTLVEQATLGTELADEIGNATVPVSLLVSADNVQRIAREHSQTFQVLQDALANEKACIVGGEKSDATPLTLLSIAEAVASLTDGIAQYQRHLGARPVVFGRRRFGLSSLFPQVLAKSGFIGALHFSLDGSRCPESYHGAMTWQSADGSQIPALARPPLDANCTESFLALPQHLGDVMDSDHVAAILFAHWPGHVSTWYRDLQRIDKYGSVLGKFVTVNDFFEQCQLISAATQFDADDYRIPYLRQTAGAGQASITPVVERIQLDATRQLVKTIDVLAVSAGRETVEVSENCLAASESLAAVLPNSAGEAKNGYFVVNPYNTERSVAFATPLLDTPPDVQGAVKMAYEKNGIREVLVEAPPNGYVWVAGNRQKKWHPPSGKPLIEKNVLRNEHFEVCLNAETGAIQSVHSRRQRGNLFSQRLALRLPQPSQLRSTARYSVMAADSIEIGDEGPLSGLLNSRGRLLDTSGDLLARFDQMIRIERDSPILHFDVLLDPVVMPQGNPWHSYYCARFAFPTAVEMRRGVGLGSHATIRQRIEAPHYVDLNTGSTRITLLTCGLPYHLQVSDDHVDTLLIVPGEPARRFPFAIGFNLPSPAQEALAAIAPPCVISRRQPDMVPSSSWFFCADSRHVVTTSWESVIEDGTNIGVRTGLFETSGHSRRVNFQSFRVIQGAWKLDYLGNRVDQLQSDGERVTIELEGHEYSMLELDWQP